MNNQRNMGDVPLFVFSEYITWFVISNFYFIILNFPLVFIVMTLNKFIYGSQLIYGVMIFIFSINIGPSLTALLSVMDKILCNKDTNITQDFFKAYKANFSQSIVLWIFQLVLFSILYFDIRLCIMNSQFNIISYIFLFLTFIIFTLGLYIYPIISKFNIRSLDVIKLSFVYSIRKFPITFIDICVIIIVLFLLIKVTPITGIFIFSCACYMIMYFEKNTLKEIEVILLPKSLAIKK